MCNPKLPLVIVFITAIETPRNTLNNEISGTQKGNILRMNQLLTGMLGKPLGPCGYLRYHSLVVIP